MKILIGSAVVVGVAMSSQALANTYSCQADLVLRSGQIITSSIGDGFSQGQACQNALAQCQDDLITFQQQGRYRGAACRIGYDNGPVYPGPFPPNPGPFPPNPGPFHPNPGPFPPNPGNSFEISCSSYNYDVNYCYVGPYAYDVRILDQYSNQPCRKNQTFGLQGEYIWVRNGCSGTFGVGVR